MPGRTTGDNKFGPSKWIVGPILGDGVNYSTIQSAILDAYATGLSQDIYIRPGTYVENLSLRKGINLIGAQPTGWQGNSFTNSVIVQGNHSLNTDADGGGECSLSAIRFETLATAAATFHNTSLINQTSGIVLRDCSIFNDSNKGFTSLTGIFLDIFDCYIDTDQQMVNLAVLSQTTIEGGTYACPGNAIFELTNENLVCRNAQFTAATNVVLAHPSGSSNFNFCTLDCQEEAFNLDQAGCRATNCHINSNAPSGFWATGNVTSTLIYSDITNSGVAFAIDPTLTASILDWKPYATSAAVASPSGDRGTAQFNSADFTVVDGFVSAVGGGGGASLSPYIVGTTGSSDFALIQDAIDATVTNFGGSGTVYIKPGTYIENLDFTGVANISLQAFTSLGDCTPVLAATLGELQVRVEGNVTIPTAAAAIQIQGIRFVHTAATPMFDIGASIASLNIVDCLVSSSADSLFVIANGVTIVNGITCASSYFTTAGAAFEIGDGCTITVGTDNCSLTCQALSTVGNLSSLTLDDSDSTIQLEGILGATALLLDFGMKGTRLSNSINPILEGGATTVCRLVGTNSFVATTSALALSAFSGSEIKFFNSTLPYAPGVEPDFAGQIILSQCAFTSSGTFPLGSASLEVYRSSSIQSSVTPWKGAASLRNQASLLTTDGASHTLFNIANATSTPLYRSYTMYVTITCRNDVSEDAASFFIEVAAKYDSGAGWLMIPGSPSTTSYTDAGFGVTATATAGAALSVDVTGIAGQNIYWFAEYELIQVGTDA